MAEGVVIVVPRDGRFLIIRRSAHVVVPGAWCFVGGAIEEGESHEQAAVREFTEEVGGRIRPLRQVWEYTRPSDGLKLYWWLAELLDGELTPNPYEVGELRWCTPDEIEQLPGLLDGNRAFVEEVGRGLLGDIRR
ncbi:MAG: NUDIX domain-containing protein [Phycisphaerae bacterium]|nr:NUDIX domain-containing protein [Phycisphaerae bacterium]